MIIEKPLNSILSLIFISDLYLLILLAFLLLLIIYLVIQNYSFRKKINIEEKYFSAYMDNVKDSIFFKDKDCRFVRINKSTVEKFGVKSEKEIIGKTDFDLFANEHASAAYNDEIEIMRSGKPIIAAVETETWRDGRVTYVSTSKFPFYDNKNRVVGTFGVSRDITSLKLTEKALRQEKERSELIFNLVPSAVFTVDLEKRITSWNHRAEEITGYSAEEVLGKECILFSESPCKDHCGLFDGEIPKPIFHYDCEIITKAGYKRNITKSIELIRDVDGKVIGGIESFEDITEKLETDKVQRALYRISQAVNNFEDINDLYSEIHAIIIGLMPAENFYIAIYDEENNQLSFPYFVDQFDESPGIRKPGRGLTEYILRTGQNLLVDEELDNKLCEQGEIDVVGEPAKIWLGIALKADTKTFGVLVVQDYENPEIYGEKEKEILNFVSEQIASAILKKQTEKQILKYSEELKELNASKDKFFSIIAHDLKSPFTALLGYSEIIQSDYDTMDGSELREFTKNMHEVANSVYNLLENLLEWSRIQTGNKEYKPEKVELNEIVNNIFMLFEHLAISKKIELIKNFDLDITVEADKNMVNTVFRNLLSNAIKFTKVNGQIKISAEKIKDEVVVSVADSGIGMSEDDLNKLFRIDIHHTTIGTGQEKGTGLGLILCKELIEKNKGQIKVASKQNEGTTFTFNLPAGT